MRAAPKVCLCELPASPEQLPESLSLGDLLLHIGPYAPGHSSLF